MSFFRHQEIYRSDVGRRDERIAAPSHRCDEFPAGYSLAGCSPAEPASASPAKPSLGGPVSCDNCFAANGDVSLISLSHFGAPPQPGQPRAKSPVLTVPSPKTLAFAQSALSAPTDGLP